MPIQSFSSSLAWHPAPRARLEFLSNPDCGAYVQAIAVILVSVLLSWHVFGAIGGVARDSFALGLTLSAGFQIFFIVNGLWLCATFASLYRVTPRQAFRKAGFWLLTPFLFWSFWVVVASSQASMLIRHEGISIFRDGTGDLRLGIAKFIGFINLLLLVVLTAKFGEFLGRRKLGSSVGAWTFVWWTLLTFAAWQVVGGALAALLLTVMTEK